MMLAYKEYLDKDKLGVYDGLMVKGMGKYSWANSMRWIWFY
jgi:hypothetical protein